MEDKLVVKVPQRRYQSNSPGNFTDAEIVQVLDNGGGVGIQAIANDPANPYIYVLSPTFAAVLNVGDKVWITNLTLGGRQPVTVLAVNGGNGVVTVDSSIGLAPIDTGPDFLNPIANANALLEIPVNLLNRGDRMGSGGALLSNLVQFMVGAPVVDYSSFAFSGSLGAFTGKVEFIDTTLPSTGQASRTAFSKNTAYTHYTNNLMQNRPTLASTATGRFTIVASASNYLVNHPTLGNAGFSGALYSSTATLGLISPDTNTDLYDRNGNFVLTIHISSAAGETWGSGPSATFDVINPTYTDELNWSDMANTNRASTDATSDTVLHFDAKRNLNLASIDAMELYDIQGISFGGRNIDAQVYPVVKLSQDVGESRGGFSRPDVYSPTTNAIFTQFGAARCFGEIDPAIQEDRSADYFTIFRGPGYVRMLGQVDPRYTSSITYIENDGNAFFITGEGVIAGYDALNAPLSSTSLSTGDLVRVTNVTRNSASYPYEVGPKIVFPAIWSLINLSEGFDPLLTRNLAGGSGTEFLLEKINSYSAQDEKDVSYFFGMFRPYEEVTEYAHPMAFLGDVGFRSTGAAANRTRPWWRSAYGSLNDTDSNIWSQGLFGLSSSYWTLKVPFILDHNFVMG